MLLKQNQKMKAIYTLLLFFICSLISTEAVAFVQTTSTEQTAIKAEKTPRKWKKLAKISEQIEEQIMRIADRIAPANEEHSRNELRSSAALLAMIFGIASIPMMILFFPVGILLAIAAIVLGVVGKKRAEEYGMEGRGMAIAGMVLGIVGIALTLAVLVVLIVILGNL